MLIPLTKIQEAVRRLEGIVSPTPLQYSERLSNLYHASVYLKREDLTKVRSFKIRGAYNKIATLSDTERAQGVVCASAGNHAQGVAYSCVKCKTKGVIFMPVTTPNQKVEKVRHFGGKYARIELVGATFDETSKIAQEYCKTVGAIFVHPFDDVDVMAGQGTVGKEIVEQFTMINAQLSIDYVFSCIGGGGLISGISSYIKQVSPHTKVIGAEPEFADSMYQALKAGKPVTLEKFETFVDGAAVRTTGKNTLSVVKDTVREVTVVPVGLVCSTMIDLYQNEGIIAEPAGALAVASLEHYTSEIKDKTVVCIVSGGNNDLLRYPEILERSLVYKGLKHYFIIEFAQKPGQLRNFLNHALGPHDDIVLFEYLKRTNKEKGPALVGIELKNKEGITPLIEKMDKIQLTYKKITSDDLVFNLLI
jgi:threonine dehydratase